MGFSSGNEIFEPVGRRIQALDMPPHLKIPLLRTLIKSLQDMDWDTEDESLREFRNDPDFVTAFSLCGIRLGLDD